CIWDEEYVWARFTNGLKYKGYPTTTIMTNNHSLTDLGYRKVREDMEKLAFEQRIQSWTTIWDQHPDEGLENLKQRYSNYMEILCTNHISMRGQVLPDSWALMLEGITQFQQDPNQMEAKDHHMSDQVE